MNPLKCCLFSTAVVLTSVSALAGCGGGNVATIDNKVNINKDSYERFLNSALATYQKAGNQLDAPDFDNCIAGQKKNKTSEEVAKKNCQQQYQKIERQVFGQLVQQGWALAAAEAANIQFNNKQINADAQLLEKQYPKVDNGPNQDDFIWLAKANNAQAQLQQKSVAQIKPTEAELARFFEKNKKQFNKPRSRDMSLLVASSKAEADKAAKALRGGASWDDVFQKYNDPKLYNSQSARVSNVSAANFAPALTEIIFAAPLNKVYGPKEVKPINGWALVQVTSASPAQKNSSFAKAKDQVLSAYRDQALSRAGSNKSTNLAAKYQPLTNCADDYKNWYPCKGTRP